MRRGQNGADAAPRGRPRVPVVPTRREHASPPGADDVNDVGAVQGQRATTSVLPRLRGPEGPSGDQTFRHLLHGSTGTWTLSGLSTGELLSASATIEVWKLEVFQSEGSRRSWRVDSERLRRSRETLPRDTRERRPRQTPPRDNPERHRISPSPSFSTTPRSPASCSVPDLRVRKGE